MGHTVGVLDFLVHASPLLNTLLIVMLGAYVLVRSSTWTGTSQEVRITKLEEGSRRHGERLDRIEHNLHRAVSEFDTTLIKMSGQLTGLVDRMSDLQREMEKFERRFAALGCGHPECPRTNGDS